MTLTSLNLLTDSMENLDIPKYEMPDFTDPYKSIGFVWEITSIIFNAYIIYRAAQGWLIKPRITKQVVYASSLAIFWILINLIQFFIQHRTLSILNAWTGYPLTLLVGLQHIELLKLFVSLSDFWTERKCKIFQLILVVFHLVITSPEYIWPLGLENNKGLRGV